ncbi:ABC transporter substrate-binding protein [Halomonas urumqiensis]|uniref:ABC transporter substrate-binding protein n=1 Tax=Halomonas urumqiensis TaxID=1684789 RepID=A0A2N7UEX3_9GAMM|nr:ABC transporter substrate-binding protein [Halomonas urumqiensis]PMR79006.1 ABC transporter substrate-binding protein [Halomonas urumqiensis]PTB01000.1 ABC transporter substrate-binding protein [Halomonas urumqiensis]GHE22945.1 ABC transporter substrate-binding protein [Halomonas urumqiensis]
MRARLSFPLTALAAGLLSAGQASAQDPVELTMYYPIAVGGALTDVIDGLVDEFEAEHPDIDVEAIYAGNYDDTRVRAMSAIEAGDPPQLSVLFSIDLYELLEQDAIIAFDEVIETDEQREWLDSFYPGLMENGQVDGQTYGIPFQRSTIVLYWNKDAFEAAGLDPETPPETWDEMAEMASAVHEASDGEQWGVMVPSTGYPYWMFQAFAFQNGHRLMSDDGTEVYFDDPAAIEALEYWVSLADEHDAMPDGAIEWGTLRQNFLEQSTAMIWHSTGNLTAVRNDAEFDFGVAMLPMKTQRGSPTGGGNFYLFKDSSEAEQQAAMTFIQWMTDPERAAAWSIETGYMGVSPAAYDTEALRDYVESFPPAAVARDQLEHGTAELSTYQGGRIRRALDNAVQAALTGQMSAAEALAQAQAEADAALRRYAR